MNIETFQVELSDGLVPACVARNDWQRADLHILLLSLLAGTIYNVSNTPSTPFANPSLSLHIATFSTRLDSTRRACIHSFFPDRPTISWGPSAMIVL